MNEQRRIFITMILCFGVFWAWQAIFPPPVPVQENNLNANATIEQPATLPAMAQPAPHDLAQVSGTPKVALVQQVVENSFLRGLLENDQGALVELDLKTYSERRKSPEDPFQPVSLVARGSRQASVTWLNDAKDVPQLEFSAVTPGLLQKNMESGLSYSLKVTPGDDSYALQYKLTVENRGTVSRRVGAIVDLALTQDGESKKGWFSGEGDQVRAICKTDTKVSRQTLDQLGKKSFIGRAARWVAIDRQYFATGIIAEKLDLKASCNAIRDGQNVKVSYVFSEEELVPGKLYERDFTLYAGPKHSHRLSEIPAQTDANGVTTPARFEEIIDYSFAMIPLGFLARPMVWLLGILHNLTSSWGVAIILLTVTVKLILFPVTYKSALSMRKMQEMKPELDKIRAQYKQDPEKQQAAQLKAYKDNGVNPAGGCLPMLLQIPVWATLYRTLWSCVDLYQQPFLWLQDLTLKEPFPFLALAVGAVTVLQQRLMPQATDNEQMRIMMIVMPIVLTGFMVALPSGLVLYVLVNSVLTIIQQLAINRRTRPA